MTCAIKSFGMPRGMENFWHVPPSTFSCQTYTCRPLWKDENLNGCHCCARCWQWH